MTAWRWTTIGELGTVVTGSTPPSMHPNWFGDELPFITPSDMVFGERRPVPERMLSEEGRVGLGKRVVPPGSSAFVCIGATIGKVCLLDSEAVTNQQINSVVPNDTVDPRFVYSLLRYAAPTIALSASGAATPIINKTVFSSINVRVPDQFTQSKIGEVLGSIDDLIESNRRRVELLEQMARTIYREWFVYFRYPGHEDVPLVDSALGPIPQGWEASSIGTVLQLKYGKALKANDRAGGTVAVVGSSGVVGWHDTALVPGPSLVVGRKGNVGSIVWIDGPSWPIDTTYFVETSLPLRFVAEQLRRTEFINSHAAVPGLSREMAYNKEFLLPTPEVMAEYEATATTLSLESRLLTQKTERLGTIRDMLLPKLVTGQIDVSELDLDALVSEANAS